jgi:hypothetical protein
MATDIEAGPVIIGGCGRGFDREIGRASLAPKQRDYRTE